jgi:hypothetical protein
MDSDAEDFLGGVKSVGIPPSRRGIPEKQIFYASGDRRT